MEFRTFGRPTVSLKGIGEASSTAVVFRARFDGHGGRGGFSASPPTQPLNPSEVNLVNAAFVLMTTAWLASGHHQSAASCGPTCNDAVASCDSGCNGFAHSLRDRLRGIFSRGHCDSCSTCEPAPVKHHACAPKTCAPACAAPSCDPCESAGHRFLGKLRGLFHRNNDCCEASCGDACAPAAGTAAPSAPSTVVPEQTQPPKKMPSTKEPPPAGKQVFEIQPAQPQIIQQSAAPAVLQSQPIPEIIIPVVGQVIRIE